MPTSIPAQRFAAAQRLDVIWLPTFLLKQRLATQASLGHPALISAGGSSACSSSAFTDTWSRKNRIVGARMPSAALGHAHAHAGSLERTTAAGLVPIASFYFGSTRGSTDVPELLRHGAAAARRRCVERRRPRRVDPRARRRWPWCTRGSRC